MLYTAVSIFETSSNSSTNQPLYGDFCKRAIYNEDASEAVIVCRPSLCNKQFS